MPRSPCATTRCPARCRPAGCGSSSCSEGRACRTDWQSVLPNVARGAGIGQRARRTYFRPAVVLAKAVIGPAPRARPTAARRAKAVMLAQFHELCVPVAQQRHLARHLWGEWELVVKGQISEYVPL